LVLEQNVKGVSREKLKVALVGNGNVFNLAHRDVWKSMRDIEIVATCDSIAERAERACKETGAQRYYTNIADLLSEDGIELVDLCVPTYEHARLSIAALEAGKHVICEKPMARSRGEAEAMLNAAGKSGKELFIAHTRRFDRRWLRMKETIDAGRIGTPVYLRRSERSWLPFPPDSWHWDMKRSGGVLLDLGVHCVSIVKWFMESAVEEVYATGKMIRAEAQQMQTCDLVSVLLRLEGGKTAFFDVSWAFPQTYGPFYSSLDLVGTKGRLEYNDKQTNPLLLVTDRIEYPRYWPLLSTDLSSFRDEMCEFVRCIETNEEPVVTKEAGYEILEIVLAAEESIARGKPVRM
jgi:UDP-N-acetylglucosamine 3-dehydrogenase